MNLKDEKILVAKAKTDPDAFGQLFDWYYPRIYGYTLKRTGNVALAEDIVSETFLKALKKLSQFQWRGIPFSAWLYRIAINEINNYYRKNKVRLLSLEHELQENGLEVSDFQTPESYLIEAQDLLAQHEEYLKIQKGISKLSIKYQEVLSLRFFEHKKIDEISQILGKKQGTIKSLLHRGIKNLKLTIDELEPQPSVVKDVVDNEGRSNN